MLYIILLTAFIVWMIFLMKKQTLSWHAYITAYSIGVYVADVTEVSFNLLLGLYKFPTHLLTDPVFDNELGIVFSDTMILPIALIIFLYYAKKERPWRTSLPFVAMFIVTEIIFLITGYVKYIHWSLLFSALAYIFAFRLAVQNALRISHYDPPIPYFVRLMCFSHTIIMWAGAIFALPLLKMYQFRPGVFEDIMADCRFTDLLSGDILSIILTLVIPRIQNRHKAIVFTAVTIMGTAFALFANYSGWLIYHRWNHILMALRYFVPILLIFLYDRWEFAYKAERAKA